MGNMSKLLNRSLRRLMIYAGLVLVCSIPAYYFIFSRLWQYELSEHNVVVTAEASREDSYLIIVFVTGLTVLFFALLIVGLILVNRRISNRLWQPFYRSLAQIKGFDLDQQQPVEFEKTDIDEFRELNQSLHKLIAGNVAVYNQQKEFADNASHELQTPLAIIQSKLDLLLQSQSLTDEQYNIIEEANKALARVTRINKNLLLLTKIENSQFMEKERIDLSALLQNTLPVFASFAEDKQLTLQTDIQPGVMVEGNKILIEILLNNLVTNAIRYSPASDAIAIRLDKQNLSITNAGTAPLKQEQLFKRFSSISSQTPGTGLGLALVKQISNRYGWNIGYAFSNNLHTFTLTF
jgi:signal transduction histidine kinase